MVNATAIQPWNATMTEGVYGILKSIQGNIPFAFPLVNIVLFFVLLYYTSQTNYGRKKYLPVLFVLWVLVLVQLYYGLVDTSFFFSMTFVYLLTALITYMFGE